MYIKPAARPNTHNERKFPFSAADVFHYVDDSKLDKKIKYPGAKQDTESESIAGHRQQTNIILITIHTRHI